MLTFLTDFESGKFTSAYDEYRRSGRNPKLVDRLIAKICTSGFVYRFDWTKLKLREQTERIEIMTAIELRMLLTMLVRGDRFFGGAMPGACSDGTIQRVLRRLQDLHMAQQTGPFEKDGLLSDLIHALRASIRWQRS